MLFVDIHSDHSGLRFVFCCQSWFICLKCYAFQGGGFKSQFLRYVITTPHIWMSFKNFQYSFYLTVPTHNKVIKRECFNNWYSPKIFNLALFITDCPITVLCVLLFLIPMYIMTNQPLELFRFGSCFLILLLLSYNSQNIGLLAGSVKNVLVSVFSHLYLSSINRKIQMIFFLFFLPI